MKSSTASLGTSDAITGMEGMKRNQKGRVRTIPPSYLHNYDTIFPIEVGGLASVCGLFRPLL
ncbi:MAG: hypothetical protein MUP70_01595 [Candidatus Aminicenantes bacterium]|nr:hypothetical protein [Candidatus Aminicenantes bacterium]